VAALNGMLGDYLVRTNNPLAISMSLRRHGRSFSDSWFLATSSILN
jgi:hypothetical protein